MSYLGSADTPKILTDDKEKIITKLRTEFLQKDLEQNTDITALKNLLAYLTEKRKADTLNKQVKEIKDYKLYDDIQNTFIQIEKNELYDTPLMLEWNVWRAMTMLDGGNVKANMAFDDFGKPLSVAQGNMADIVCDYGDYMLIVEVTMASGQKQYEMESEPVSRHLGKTKRDYSKPCYCLFVAPKINEACVAHFYALHKMNICYYGGKSVIIPLPLDIFRKMLEDSYKVNYKPNPKQVRSLFEYSEQCAMNCENENIWYKHIKEKAINWLA